MGSISVIAVVDLIARSSLEKWFEVAKQFKRGDTPKWSLGCGSYLIYLACVKIAVSFREGLNLKTDKQSSSLGRP